MTTPLDSAVRHLAALAILVVLPLTAAAQTIRIDIGTVATEGTPWFEILNRMKQDWAKASKDKVVVRVFGGTIGDEKEMVDQVRLGELQAVGASSIALSRIARGVGALQLPMVVDTYDDLDRVRVALESRLEEAMAREGFIVLNWSDVGWVQFFANKKVRTPEDLKKLKLFINADDPDSERLYLDLGFRPVPVGATDLFTSLTTGLIDAFDVPPLFALRNQSFGLAKHMIDLRWAPLVGATIIDKKVWEKIDPQLRPELMRIARASGKDLRAKIRASGEDAIVQMKAHGLIVEALTPAEKDQWRAMARIAIQKLRERGFIPGEYIDEAILYSVDPVSGPWTGDWGTTAADRSPFRLDLKWDGKAVTGVLQPLTPQRPAAGLRNSTFNPATGMLRLEIEVAGLRGAPSVRHILEGKVADGAVTGVWNPGASRGDFKLKKGAAAPPAPARGK
jgi:TRAP-type C4-dicarboxylate transport system substrate-binding protein